MPRLSRPVPEVRLSFIAAMREFQAEGRGGADDLTNIGDEIRDYADTWSTPEGFTAYVARLRDQALEDSARPEGYVPSTTLWWIEGDDYLGRLAIRHRLTPRLREAGGHIGYDVRPSARRRGHATAMLRAAVPVARKLGIDQALITCDVDNIASRRVIERNGGVRQDRYGDKWRFWVPTAPHAGDDAG
jgi:predicted acetyltransferase